MLEYLPQYAKSTIWCNPAQDRQYIFEPVLISPPYGARNFIDVINDRLYFPDENKYYHVYQVGQLHPSLIGLFYSYRKVSKLKDAFTPNNLICDVFDISGIQYPRYLVYYHLTENKNLVLIVEKPPRDIYPFDFKQPKIFFRVYRNAYFNSVRADNPENKIQVTSKYVGNNNDITYLRGILQDYRSSLGYTYLFINGFYSHDLTVATVKIGDVVDIINDSSIKRVIDFNIKGLDVFNSILTNERRYLLHYSGSGSTIDYHDDIDLFMIKKDTNSYKGIQLHKSVNSIMNNLTHKDYSVSVDMVTAFFQGIPYFTNMNDLTLRLHIRHAGFQRPLEFNSSKIHELYKLKDLDIFKAMLGVDSVYNEFTAYNLEASPYMELIGYNNESLPNELTEDAFGFNAISRILADSPMIVNDISGFKEVSLKHGLTTAATIFKYDVNGILLGYLNQNNYSKYTTNDNNVHYIEAITGNSSKRLDEYHNVTTIDLEPDKYNYRFYVCGIYNGLPDGNWTDVTGSDNYTLNPDTGKLIWNLTNEIYYTVVRSNKNNLLYEFDLMVDRGLLQFSLTQEITLDGNYYTTPMSIPMGSLDIWLNGYSLIEGIDYLVSFPYISITNKKYLIDPHNQEQNVVVKFSGFCDSNFKHDTDFDYGPIQYGVLSYNNKFDIRDDKILRIVANGRLWDRDELEYSETSEVLLPSDEDAGIYMIKTVVPAVQAYLVQDQYDLYDISKEADERLSDYMDIKFDTTKSDDHDVIQEKYRIYSPFIARVLEDVLSGVINDPRILTDYNEMDVRDILSDYEYLLDYDPINIKYDINLNYIEIDGHYTNNVIDVNIYQLKFMFKVLQYYTNGIVKMNHVLRLVEF